MAALILFRLLLATCCDESSESKSVAESRSEAESRSHRAPARDSGLATRDGRGGTLNSVAARSGAGMAESSSSRRTAGKLAPAGVEGAGDDGRRGEDADVGGGGVCVDGGGADAVGVAAVVPGGGAERGSLGREAARERLAELQAERAALAGEMADLQKALVGMTTEFKDQVNTLITALTTGDPALPAKLDAAAAFCSTLEPAPPSSDDEAPPPARS